MHYFFSLNIWHSNQTQKDCITAIQGMQYVVHAYVIYSNLVDSRNTGYFEYLDACTYYTIYCTVLCAFYCKSLHVERFSRGKSPKFHCEMLLFYMAQGLRKC